MSPDMSDQAIKNAISTFLHGQGFHVLQIPEGERRTPDLLATRDHRYLIEIKTKENDPAAISERTKRLGAGQIVESGAPFTPQNTMSPHRSRWGRAARCTPSTGARLLHVVALGRRVRP
jgi:hypothetical protein